VKPTENISRLQEVNEKKRRIKGFSARMIKVILFKGKLRICNLPLTALQT